MVNPPPSRPSLPAPESPPLAPTPQPHSLSSPTSLLWSSARQPQASLLTSSAPLSPLLTATEFELLVQARRAGALTVQCSLDLQRSITTVDISGDHWDWMGRRYAFPERVKDRTIYYWADGAFQPVARYAASLIKLVPTEWGAPTFEIDGIKMLPTAEVSPYVDAQRKVELIQPRGKVILDTCGGLGYFAAWCEQGKARQVLSFEKNPDVIWLRTMNPWSPASVTSLILAQQDVTLAVTQLASRSVDAILHDPPRFGIAGELYSQTFYDELSRVLKRRGRLFHYTGSPNRLTTGRNVPNEVGNRLRNAGFTIQPTGDGLLAIKK
jgi:uncharacterized protein